MNLTYNNINRFGGRSKCSDLVRSGEALRIPRIMEYRTGESQTPGKIYSPVSIQIVMPGGVSNSYGRRSILLYLLFIILIIYENIERTQIIVGRCNFVHDNICSSWGDEQSVDVS